MPILYTDCAQSATMLLYGRGGVLQFLDVCDPTQLIQNG